MADDTRTEGLRGIGADGFIRTVSNLTVTGDLVVHGETRSTIGTGSAFWETADANANYWAYDLPSGGSVNVPVFGVGIGLDGVDLGLFDGITQTTLAVLDADRDSYIALDFSADDSPRIRSNQDITVSGNVTFSDNITVQGTTTTINSSTTVIQDPLFHLGNDNSADSVDLGIFAEYTDSGKKFSGLFRDASDSDKWKLFATTGNSHEEPTTTVNTTSGFTLATLAVNELEGTITTAAQTNITSVGALDGGSITSNFGAIDNGSSAITTTGLISGGSLDIDSVLINGTTIGHTDDTDLITVADGSATLAGILIIDGNRSVTPSDGAAIHVDTHTVTDSNTSGSGTAAKFTQVNFEAPTLAATNSSVTTSDAATLYISGAPSAGTNQTITRGWAVWVDAGNVRFDGSLYAGTTEAMDSSGLVTVANQSNITGVGTITSGTWEGTTVAVDQGGTGATSLNNLITLGTHTTGSYVATITGGTGIVSDAGTSGENLDHTLSIDLNEVGEVAIANGDYIAFMDATDSGATKKEALHDVATLFAGTGLSASSSVINVDAAQTGITSVGALDGGSITSNFGSIDNGASAITTTGAISGGTIDATTDFTIGTTVITDDSIVMTPDTSDTVTIAAAANGALNITTVDNAAAAANIQITADGTAEMEGTTVTLDSGGDVVLSAAGGQVTVDDGSTTVLTFDAAEPSLTISDDADTGDLFKISVGAAALTTIATTDDDAGLGHLTIRPDGYLIVQQDSVTLDATLDNVSLVAKDFDTVTNSAIALSSKGTGTKPSVFLGTGNNSAHMMLSTGARQQASVWTGGGIAPDANNATIMESIATTAAIYRHWYGGHYFYGDVSLTAHDGGDPNEYAPTLLATLAAGTGRMGVLGGVVIGQSDLGAYNDFTGGDTKLIDDASNGSAAATLYIGNTTITTSSDRRIKKDIVDTSVNARQTLDRLRVVDFMWDDPTDTAPNNRNMRGQWTGMIAQEAVDIVPYIINAPRSADGVIDYDSEITWTVDYQHLVPMLVKAVQELNVELQELKGGS